jgi:hypothetical protein
MNGLALMRINDDDISQLLCTLDEDGVIQRPTIGEKTRFRSKLEDWKIMVKLEKNKQENNGTENE